MPDEITKLVEKLDAECTKQKRPLLLITHNRKTGDTIRAACGEISDLQIGLGILFISIAQQSGLDAVDLAKRNVKLVKKMRKDGYGD